MSEKLSKEQIESIKNYGSNIKTLKDFITAVQKKPGMYIGYLGNRGYLNMIKEIFDNSIDEIQRQDSPATWVRVFYDQNTKKVTVEDNGRGIPFDNIVRIYTAQHTSSNYEKKLYDYTSGTHGVGGKVTNALSEDFEVISYVLGDARRMLFHLGYPTKDKEEKYSNKENKQGTYVCFTPNEQVLGEVTLTSDEVLSMIQNLLPLTNIGTKVIFESQIGRHFDRVELTNTDGIMSYLIDNCENPFIKPIEFANDIGTMRAHIMMEYSSDSTNSISSFSNFCKVDTIESTHVKGFFAGLKKFFVPYMNKVYLVSAAGRKKNIVVNETDVKSGLHVVLDVAHLDPVFTGQAKDVLSNDDMIPFVRDLTYAALEEWAKNNPTDLQKVCKFIKEQAVIRLSVDEKKIKLKDNYKSSKLTGLPSKYVKPTERMEDFFIVEGDSAGGSFRNFRHNKTQGVFPIRGKILNCFEKPISKCLENAEVAGIMAIIGGGNGGKDFDINKVKWKRVISAADADSAGNHINALLLRLVLRLCPDLILAGKFYRAVPPLYMAVEGKGKRAHKIYFTDRLQLVQYVNEAFSKNNEILTPDKKKMSKKDIEKLLYINLDYIMELNRIANLYKVNPRILELYLNNRTLNAKKICGLIKQRYRFMDMANLNGQIISDGIADGVSNTLFIGDRLLSDSQKIIDIIDNNLYTEYYFNGKPATILDIMETYENTKPSNITRIKGLGEQDGEELAQSVILPGDMGNRTLIKYTMSSAMEEIERIRYYENNKNKLLDNLVVTRLDITD